MIFICWALLSCGEANVFSPTYGKTDLQAYEPALDQAEIYYDKGDHEQATAYAMKAYEQNPRSERAATILAYAVMGLTGLDPIEITKTLNKKDEATADESSEKSKSSNTSAFSNLHQILGVDQAFIESLGEFDDRDADYPLLLPLCAEAARQQIEKLALIDKAIHVLCPFVNPDIRLPSDYRHNCEAIDLEVQSPGKIHFVWGLAHLAEGVFFNAALSYKTDNADADVSSNLEMRVRSLGQIATDSPQGVKRSMAAMAALNASMNIIFDQSKQCDQGMLVANFNDLMAVNQAFLSISGLPKNILKPIEKVMKSMEGSAQENPAAGSSVSASGLQAVLTQKLEGDLKSKIDGMASSSQASPEDLQEACGLYSSMLPTTAPPQTCE